LEKAEGYCSFAQRAEEMGEEDCSFRKKMQGRLEQEFPKNFSSLQSPLQSSVRKFPAAGELGCSAWLKKEGVQAI
jgi:hypothetical protein